MTPGCSICTHGLLTIPCNPARRFCGLHRTFASADYKCVDFAEECWDAIRREHDRRREDRDEAENQMSMRL
jgi:hypothetical protein